MILLTGGAGYIGSHVAVALLDAGLDVVAVDNLSNSNEASLERVQTICGRSLVFRHADICNEDAIYQILRAYEVTAVIHLAGFKAVGDSNVRPMTYYENNVVGTMRLVSAMTRASVKTLVFSSSATVYGAPVYLPLDEKHPVGPTNPYGRTKLFIEEILKDLHRSDGDWRIGVLRYFNPVGAHESGLIGEDPLGVPNNLLPFVAQVAIGKREKLHIWGNDYDTSDGTGDPRLHSCRGSCIRASKCFEPPEAARRTDRQSRNRKRQQRPGGGSDIRGRERQANSLCDRRTPGR